MTNPSFITKAEYLGDGLYIDEPYHEYGGKTLRISSFSGVEVLEEVYLEQAELTALIREAHRRGFEVEI